MVAALFSGMTVTASADAPEAGAYFCVKMNRDAGLGGDVRIDMVHSLGVFKGELYLPGSADTSGCFLSWQGDMRLTDGANVYASGEAPIAPDGKSVTYSAVGAPSVKYTISTHQGSASVEGMFIVFDEGEDVAAMNSDPDHETSCRASISFGGSTYYTDMKGRGNSTWLYYSKKPYNITFYKDEKHSDKKKVSLIEGTKTKKWSLIANAMDQSLLRNRLDLGLASELGIGIPTRYADVWMDGEYRGNYLITPKNDYEVTDEGYLLEFDNHLSKEDPQFLLPGLRDGNVTYYYNRVTVKDVGDDAGVDEKDIEEWMIKVWEAVLDYDSEDYQNYVDLDSWAKMYLIYEFDKDYDAVSGSLLMHRDGTTEDDKLIAGPLWDRDTTLGRLVYNPTIGASSSDQLSAEGWYNDGLGGKNCREHLSFLQELGKHASFMERVNEVFVENEQAFASVTEKADAEAASIAASAGMNDLKWPMLSGNTAFVSWIPLTLGSGKFALNYVPTYKWEDFVTNLKEYTSKRYAYMADVLHPATPSGTLCGVSDFKAGDKLLLSVKLDQPIDGVTYQWQSSEDGLTWTPIDGAVKATYAATAPADAGDIQYRCVVTNSKTGANKNSAGFANTVSAVIGPDGTQAPGVTVNVTVKKPTVQLLLYKLFGVGLFRVGIDADAYGTSIESVQYSENGIFWFKGTGMISFRAPKTLNVRVTTTDGSVHNFVYRDGTTVPA